MRQDPREQHDRSAATSSLLGTGACKATLCVFVNKQACSVVLGVVVVVVVVLSSARPVYFLPDRAINDSLRPVSFVTGVEGCGRRPPERLAGEPRPHLT